MSRRALAFAAVALGLFGCGSCPDGQDPDKTTCTCHDGSKLGPDECEVCKDSDPISLGNLSSHSVSKDFQSACGQEIRFKVGEDVALSAVLHAQAVALDATLSAGDQQVGSLHANAGDQGSHTFFLEKGDYQMRLTGGSPGKFTLDLDAEPTDDKELEPDPGEDRDSAADVGVVPVSPAMVLAGYVGPTDSADYYKVEVDQQSVLTFSVQQVKGHVTMSLIPDAKVLDTANQIGGADVTNADGTVNNLSVPAGVYYFVVKGGTEPALYELYTSVEPYGTEAKRDPGQSWEDEYDLGTIGSKLVDFSNYVGKLDTSDHYRFEVDSNTTLVYSVGDVTGGLAFRLFKDETQIEATDPLAKHDMGTEGLSPNRLELAEGVYHVLVSSTDNSLYTLSFNTE
ncbi:MAG TPA: hypothetical protein VHM70_24030 [Polyangiaceae bacterium]|jgi:hypothetical protein|nr:hypothetical protein [Polyangiaceae bacterium]